MRHFDDLLRPETLHRPDSLKKFSMLGKFPMVTGVTLPFSKLSRTSWRRISPYFSGSFSKIYKVAVKT